MLLRAGVLLGGCFLFSGSLVWPFGSPGGWRRFHVRLCSWLSGQDRPGLSRERAGVVLGGRCSPVVVSEGPFRG